MDLAHANLVATSHARREATAPPTALVPGTDERLLLSLQRAAGNAAVASLLAAAQPRLVRNSRFVPGTSLSAQRQAVPPDADPDLVKRLDQMIATISAETSEFSAYKLAPHDGARLPGKATEASLRKMGSPTEGWVRRYVQEKLGPARLKLVQEMIGMAGYGFVNAEELLGVAHQSPGHWYRCDLKAATTLQEKAIAKLVPTVTITYTNAFGWHWTRDYTLAALEISAGIKLAIDKGGSVKPKGGRSIGRLDLDISGTANADPVPLRYWGGNDFGGPILVVKTSGKARVGPAGGKIPGLTAITFTGGPFGTVSFPFASGLSGSISGGMPKAEAEIGIGMGVGGAIPRGEAATVTPPPELREERRLARSFLTWTLNVGPFGTGSSTPPEAAKGWLQALRDHIEDWRHRWLDPQAGDLRAAGVDPDEDFRLAFYLTGTTSRSWRRAMSERERLERNEKLGMDRAVALGPIVKDVFGQLIKLVRSESGGTATLGPSSEENPAEYLTDEEAEKEYQRLRDEALNEPDPETRRRRLDAVEANYGKQSDEPWGRRVLVLARWEGQRIIKALVPVTPP